MITCKRCGKSVHTGSAYCPDCGLPLSQGQPELPAWLESLRTSERPVGTGASPEGQAGYSSTDFFDENTLPSWMNPEQTDISDSGNSAKLPAWRPASASAPNTDGDFAPPMGFAAGSLIDEQSLPSWLQEKQAGADQPAQKNIAASSLVQPEALPEWIRNMPQQHSSTAGQSFVPGNNIPTMGKGNQSGIANHAPAPQAFSAHELIDQQALPPWLAGQANQATPTNSPAQQPAFHNPPPAPAASQPGSQADIGASSLLDMNSLPGWLRESEQGQGYMQGQQRQSAGPGQPPNGSNNGGNLAGASLIDMNALPSWLRSSEEGAGQQAEPMSGQRPAPFGNPSRAENMRVPSRPRGEVGPYEQSEVAANVFSSMLGVASSAPYFPAQPGSTPGYQQGFQGELFQQQLASPQMGQMPVPSPSPSGSLRQVNTAMPGSQPGLAGQSYMPGGVQGYPMGNRPGASGQSLPPNSAGAQSFSAGNNQRPNTNASSAKPGRRGIIDTIRSWFSH